MLALPYKAVHEHEVRDSPAECFDRVFGNKALIVKQGHVRGEMPRHPAVQSGSYDSFPERPVECGQRRSVAARAQHKGPF